MKKFRIRLADVIDIFRIILDTKSFSKRLQLNSNNSYF